MPRTYHVLGVPLRTGSLYPGSENDAQAYRDAGLVARLQRAGRRAVDDGDVAIPSYLPHHAIPPIRSWPGPRIAWDCVADRVAPYLTQPDVVPLLVGCDCSIVVGTTQSLMRAVSSHVHVIYIDGDFDDAAPDPARCQSAAATATWLLTQPSPFWTGPPLPPSQVTVIGWTMPSASRSEARSVSLVDLRRVGAREAARRALDAIAASAPILVHFDVDVLQKADMPAAYFPHDEGLRLGEAAELLEALLADSRVRLVEVSEYASLRDLDQRHVGALVDLLTGALPV
ncbi:MAG TPA: arginase family protein [Methylomirabilota bacterium]|jgi:arginase family enzyme